MIFTATTTRELMARFHVGIFKRDHDFDQFPRTMYSFFGNGEMIAEAQPESVMVKLTFITGDPAAMSCPRMDWFTAEGVTWVLTRKTSVVDLARPVSLPSRPIINATEDARFELKDVQREVGTCAVLEIEEDPYAFSVNWLLTIDSTDRPIDPADGRRLGQCDEPGLNVCVRRACESDLTLPSTIR